MFNKLINYYYDDDDDDDDDEDDDDVWNRSTLDKT